MINQINQSQNLPPSLKYGFIRTQHWQHELHWAWVFWSTWLPSSISEAMDFEAGLSDNWLWDLHHFVGFLHEIVFKEVIRWLFVASPHTSETMRIFLTSSVTLVPRCSYFRNHHCRGSEGQNNTNDKRRKKLSAETICTTTLFMGIWNTVKCHHYFS